MAENLLDVGPPNPKRPKLNTPALSASDGPGKSGLLTLANVNISNTTRYVANKLILGTSQLATWLALQANDGYVAVGVFCS